MSDYKSRDTEKRYIEGYNEGRDGGRDYARDIAEGLFFRPDTVKSLGRKAGKNDRAKYGPRIKSQPVADPDKTPVRNPDTARSSHPSSSSGGSPVGLPAAAGLGIVTFATGMGLLIYFGWIIKLMGNGGPDTFGEFVVMLPGALAIWYIGMIVGAYLIGAVIGIGLLVGILALVYNAFTGS